MSDEHLEYEISNVGGVERAHLLLTPGINVLRGRNAIGKTSAMRAIVRAQGGSCELEYRDGASSGFVDGPGVRLRVGKVVRKTGEAELSLADVAPLSQLIDPQLKDPEAANRARIRALIDLLGLRVDDAALEALCQGDADLLEWLRAEVQDAAIDDLMAAAEKLRHRAHAVARESETAAEEAEGRAAAARENRDRYLEAVGGPGKLVETPVDEAREAFARGNREYERATAKCEAREDLERRQAEIRGTLGERPDVGAAGLAVVAAESEVGMAEDALQDLREQCARAEEKLDAALGRQQAARSAAHQAERAADAWDAAKAVLDQPPEGPTREELDALHATLVAGASEAFEAARVSQDYRDAESARQAAVEARELAQREAGRLRALAAGLPTKLGEILSEAGAAGLTVIDGRLHATVEGKALDFARRLSDGQRVRVALDVAAQAYAGNVVPLSAAHWASLDPENRSRFAALAIERGLFCLAEEPADGELRIEHVDGAMEVGSAA